MDAGRDRRKIPDQSKRDRYPSDNHLLLQCWRQNLLYVGKEVPATLSIPVSSLTLNVISDDISKIETLVVPSVKLDAPLRLDENPKIETNVRLPSDLARTRKGSDDRIPQSQIQIHRTPIAAPTDRGCRSQISP